MAQFQSKTCRLALSVGSVVLLLITLFFIVRPLYWEITAILRDQQTVTLGLSNVVMETRKTVGWYHRD